VARSNGGLRDAPQRLTVVIGTPKAWTISPWLAVPLTISWVVNNRKLAKSLVAWVNTGKWPLK
jgi:hypothetical protein